jgi:glycosyltransferase involved in cell wall biosynthesis
MRIVIDARESGSSTGRYIDNLIQQLQKLDIQHEVILLTKKPRVDFLRGIAPKFNVIESSFKEFTFSEQFGLLRQIKNLKPDLVHFGMTHQPIFYKGKTVTTVHDLTTVRFRNPAKNWFVFVAKQQVYKLVIKIVARKSEIVITPSKFVREDLANFANISKEKIIVTYEAGEEFGEVPKTIPTLAGKDFIMFNGRPLPHKNLRRLIESFKILRQKYPDLLLAIIGKKDASYKSYAALVEKLELSNYVIFTDYVPDGQLEWAMKNTRAYVNPSLSEGFWLPGLEAMHYGAPLVSSNATCLPEIYGEAMHYFDPTDVNDMANKIDDVLSDSDLRKELIRKGKTQVKKYSWRRMAEQTLEVYSKALRSN